MHGTEFPLYESMSIVPKMKCTVFPCKVMPRGKKNKKKNKKKQKNTAEPDPSPDVNAVPPAPKEQATKEKATVRFQYARLDGKCGGQTSVPREEFSCTCTSTKADPQCDGTKLRLPYETVCRLLEFDPRMPVFIYDENANPDVEQEPLQILYPWHFSARAGEREALEEDFGSRGEYETASTPFGWLDHTKPLLVLYGHYCTASPRWIRLVCPTYLGSVPYEGAMPEYVTFDPETGEHEVKWSPEHPPL